MAVPDRPGGLEEVLAKVDAAGLNIDYMVAFNRGGVNAIVILRFEDPDLAIARLQASGINVVAEVDLFAETPAVTPEES